MRLGAKKTYMFGKVPVHALRGIDALFKALLFLVTNVSCAISPWER